MSTTTTPSSNRFQNVQPETPSSEKRRLKGLWHRNEWWCNCPTRGKAIPRTVTSDTPNKGRGFWACPIPPPDNCGFLLFFDEARLREVSLSGEGAGGQADTPSKVPSKTQTRLTDIGFKILGDRRQRDPGTSGIEEKGDGKEAADCHQPKSSSQPEAASLDEDKGRGKVVDTEGDNKEAVDCPQYKGSSQPEAGASSDDDKGKGKAVDTSSVSYEPLTPGPSTGVKRKYDAFAEDDFDDMGSDDEKQLAEMTDKSVEKFIREQAYDIHTAADGEDDVLASSSRPVARTLFPQAQSAKRSKSVSFEEPEPLPPTPSKARGSQSSPTSTIETSPSSSMEAPPTLPSSAMTATQLNDEEDKDDSQDITEQVMSLLQTQSIEPSVLASVRSLLLASTRRTKGIAMGRDSARATAEEKKIKIAKLQERIVALENKEQSLNNQITHIKASLMKMYEDN
ncbi:hypothetical protein V8C42DRAFT_307645 [Trichoderma barbatum]